MKFLHNKNNHKNVFKPRKMKKETMNEKEEKVGLITYSLYIRETRALKHLQVNYQT